MRKILVTGSEGFIGSHVVEELIKQNYKVKAFIFYNFKNSFGWLEENKKKFGKLDFRKFYPSGNLGNKLKTAEDLMLIKKKIPFVNENQIMKNALKILNQKGRLTYIAALESIKAEANLLYIMSKQLKVSGSTLRSRSPEEKGKIVNQVVEHIWPLIEQGKYKPTIFQSFNMEDVNLAHELMESSSHIGKILLDIKGGQK